MEFRSRTALAGALLAALIVGGACDEGDDGPIAPPPPADPTGTLEITADITSDRTFRKDTTYVLKGFIHVQAPATLTIEAGTRIVGDYETVGSSLFITRGARIRAMGTAADPIVFTSERAPGQRQPGDWGGLIIVGNAQVNRASPVLLEGTNTGPGNPGVNYAGGTDDADSSGELHYVRVEFAGFATAQDAELNSFTFAAVGSGTQVDHLEALAGLDDHYEWFGGTMDAKYLVSYESGDDHFDMSEGYRGRLQYLIAFQSQRLTPRAGAGNFSSDPQGIENDGCGAAGSCFNGELSQPYTVPLVANFTLVGTGPGVVDGTSGGIGMLLRRGTGGYYVNGVITRWPRAAISMRDTLSTRVRLDAGELVVSNILLAENGTVFEAGGGRFTVDQQASAIVTTGDDAASLFTALPANPSAAAFDWSVPAASPAAAGGNAAFTGALAARAGTFIDQTPYRGAAGTNTARWWQGWTSYAVN